MILERSLKKRWNEKGKSKLYTSITLFRNFLEIFRSFPGHLFDITERNHRSRTKHKFRGRRILNEPRNVPSPREIKTRQRRTNKKKKKIFDWGKINRARFRVNTKAISIIIGNFSSISNPVTSLVNCCYHPPPPLSMLSSSNNNSHDRKFDDEARTSVSFPLLSSIDLLIRKKVKKDKVWRGGGGKRRRIVGRATMNLTRSLWFLFPSISPLFSFLRERSK